MDGQCQACNRSESAAQALAAGGERMTGLRREVLKALHHAARPVGAYDLFHQLKTEGHASAPPAVYRVLDFLVDKGLAHKLASLSAYAACQAGPNHKDSCFLICDRCGEVAEIDARPTDAVASAAREVGFSLSAVTVEARGRCKTCGTI